MYEVWGREDGSIRKAPLKRLRVPAGGGWGAGGRSFFHWMLTELEPHRLILMLLLVW